jgi:hypothetical protein
MAKSSATTVEDYLAELPAERRAVIEQVRDVILANLPPGYRESIGWGMINYEIPLERYPNTYNKQPLTYVSLAAQKNYYALYLMSVYGSLLVRERLEAEFARAGKKLDMGKSCVRFRRLDDLPLDVVGRIVAGTDPDAYIRAYEASVHHRPRA